MASPPVESPYIERLLDVKKLRALMRKGSSTFITIALYKRIRHQFPEILEADAPELAEMFAHLSGRIIDALRDIGIELENDGSGLPIKRTFKSLTGRERQWILACAALHGWWGYSLLFAGRTEEAQSSLIHSLAWVRSIEDFGQEAVLLSILSQVYHWTMEVNLQEESIRKAVEVAQKARSKIFYLVALIELSGVLIHRGQLDEAEECIERSVVLLAQHVPPEEGVAYQTELLIYRARLVQKRGEKGAALRFLQQALPLCDEEVYPTLRAALFLSLAILYVELEHSEQMIVCYHEAVRLAEKAKATNLQATYLVQLAFGYQRLEDFDKALEMLDKAEEMLWSYDIHQKIRILLRRANIRIVQERFDEAITLLKTAIGELNGKEIATETPTVYAMLAHAEKGRENYHEAERYYLMAIETGGYSQFRRERWLLKLAEVQLYQGKTKSAVQLLDSIEEGIKKSSQYYVDWLHLSGEIAVEKGDFQRAIFCEREAANVERSYLKAHAERSLQNARIVAEAELLEREAEHERKLRLRLRQELAQTAVDLRHQQHRIDSAKEGLTQILTHKKRQDPETILSSVRQVLNKLSEQTVEAEPSFDYLLEVGEDFFNRLRRQWPDLTVKQERLCGLIRAGLNSMQIGTILTLKPEGVKGQRKRLRKAMNLQQSQNLEKVIAEV